MVYLDFPYEKPAKTGAFIAHFQLPLLENRCASRRAQGGVFTGEAHAAMFWDTKCFDSMENWCQPMEKWEVNGVLMWYNWYNHVQWKMGCSLDPQDINQQ